MVVDNIFIFLPQECVSSFGIVTLKDLLVETEKAVGVDSMYNLHMELQKLKSKVLLEGSKFGNMKKQLES